MGPWKIRRKLLQMDDRYYKILRSTSQEKLHRAINDPEAELYDILWDLNSCHRAC